MDNELCDQQKITGPKMDSASTKLLTFSARLESTFPNRKEEESKIEIKVKETIAAIVEILLIILVNYKNIIERQNCQPP